MEIKKKVKEYIKRWHRKLWNKKEVIYFVEGIAILLIYLFTPISINDVYVFAFLLISYILIFIGTYFLFREEKYLNLIIIWNISVFGGILIDYTNLYEYFNLNENVAFWFFSAILQGFSALLGIIAAFSLFYFQIQKKDKDKKTLKEIMEPFNPAILYILIVLLGAIICLPFSRVLAIKKYQSLLSTIIFVSILLSTTAIISLFRSLLKIYTFE